MTVQKSKSGRPRQVPLTDYALEWLRSLVRYEADPYVFMLAPGRPLKDPRESFCLGRDHAGLSFVKGFHDLRHYRATQWLARGVDIRTVSHLLGNERIETTMPYLHLIPDHLDRAVRQAEESERMELKKGNLRVAS